MFMQAPPRYVWIAKVNKYGDETELLGVFDDKALAERAIETWLDANWKNNWRVSDTAEDQWLFKKHPPENTRHLVAAVVYRNQINKSDPHL